MESINKKLKFIKFDIKEEKEVEKKINELSHKKEYRKSIEN